MDIAYLDNSATTRVCPQAAEKALEMMTSCFGNPSSLHSLGAAAERELDAARQKVARLIGCRPEEIVFTSGGTEANNLALFGAAEAKKRAGRHIVTTAVEHASVAAACGELERQGWEITRLLPGPDGTLSAAQIAAACRPDTVLVSIMMVNNETGARFPVEQMAPAVRRAAPGALLHCDAVQAAGKLPLRAARWDLDLMTVSAHKIHGPKGSGALYIRKGVRLLPRVFGGGQERGLRPGTEAVPLHAAFGAAAEALPPFDEQEALYLRLHQQLTDGLAGLDGFTVNSPEGAVPYILNLSAPGIRSETLLHFLAERGVFVSSGSACSKGKKSPVLTALGLPAPRIDSALRVSFTHTTTPQEVDRLLDALRDAAATLIRRTR
ncbi:MAG TPA: cysteine desulfurase [Firmicutes bacterium]|nr:cysteine desulfurase [Bacillota bacterium]